MTIRVDRSTAKRRAKLVLGAVLIALSAVAFWNTVAAANNKDAIDALYTALKTEQQATTDRGQPLAAPAADDVATDPGVVSEVESAPGPRGPQGIPGIEGPMGPQGPRGPAGPAGPPGLTGPEGKQGAMGVRGAGGDPGPPGHDGAEGPTGPQGPQGVQGPQGETGNTGDTGPAGENGRSIVTGPTCVDDTSDEGSHWVTTFDKAPLEETSPGPCRIQPDENPPPGP